MIWVYAILIALAGVAAGYFAGLLPVIVISVIGIVFLILMLRGEHYSDAGPGIALVGLAILLFLVPMIITAVVVRLGNISAPDFSVFGSWLKSILLR